MNITFIPAKPKEKKILKVAAYCRVSTKSEAQQHSLESQREYYTKFIEDNPDWVLAGVYSDDASGRSRKKRLGLQNMLNACKRKKIDLIVTKSISRFGRNTLEFLRTVNELKALNIDVYFETDEFKLLSQENMFGITMRAAMAQDESESKSKNIKWGILRSFENPTSKYYSRVCYGYDNDENGLLKPHPEQAKIIQKIFEWYLEGYSLSGISKALSDLVIQSPSGKSTWSSEIISKLLSNEKYIGDVILGKTYIEDFFIGNQVENHGKQDQYILENNHEPIVTKELFDAVQAEKKKRTNVAQNSKSKHRLSRTDKRYTWSNSFSGKVICGECGKNYRRITKHNGDIIWRCANRVEHGKKHCKNSPTVSKDQLVKEIKNIIGITDLELDFSCSAINRIIVLEDGLQIDKKTLSTETRSTLLKKEEHTLCRQYLNGNRKAGDVLFAHHYDLLKKSVIRYAYGSILNEQDKEDLIQIIVLKALTYLKNYNGQYRFWTWMKVIMKTEFYRMLKRKSGEKQYLGDNETIINELLFDKRNDIDIWISNQRVKEWLEVLSPKEREVVVRYLFWGEMQIDIGTEKGVTRAAVSLWYRNALRKLREYLLRNGTCSLKHELNFSNTNDKVHIIDF